MHKVNYIKGMGLTYYEELYIGQYIFNKLFMIQSRVCLQKHNFGITFIPVGFSIETHPFLVSRSLGTRSNPQDGKGREETGLGS